MYFTESEILKFACELLTKRKQILFNQLFSLGDVYQNNNSISKHNYLLFSSSNYTTRLQGHKLSVKLIIHVKSNLRILFQALLTCFCMTRTSVCDFQSTLISIEIRYNQSLQAIPSLPERHKHKIVSHQLCLSISSTHFKIARRGSIVILMA